MSRIRSSILLSSLALLAALLTGCGYGFVLKGAGNLGPVRLGSSINQTPLRSAAMVLDSHLESTLAAMGVSGQSEDLPRLTCTVTGAKGQEISTNSAAENRFRLRLTVKADITGSGGESLWHGTFSDYGAYASGGQEENALDEACGKIAQRVAQSLLAIRIEKREAINKAETQDSKVP